MEFANQGFYIGSFFIRYYGIIIMVGAVLGGWLASGEAKRRGYDSEITWDMLIWLIVGGVIGARLWHVFTPTPSAIAEGRTTIFYLTHPFDLINLRNGGLGIVGAVIGGLITMYFYTRRHALNFAEWTDIAAPAVALGQAIGRWGNFVNQELYGAPTDLPWKIYIEPQYRLAGFETEEYYHPLFLYESLWNLANMALLIWLTRRYSDRLKNGDIFLIYLIVYPIGRFLLEFLRLDSSMLSGLNANQTAMALVAVLSAIALFWRHREEFTRN
jgi:phosphatidylglycerol---prolipoprotein diacylglyceryl transferase